MKKKFSEYSFAQTFLITGGIFLVIVLLIEFFYALTQMSFSDAAAGLGNPKYLLRKVLGSLIYALIMTLYFKRKSLRKKDN